MKIVLFEQFKGQRKRIIAIDFLKLFASILVIFSHCMLKYIDKGDANPLFNLIWITQMPLFMFASGMVSPSKKRIDSMSKYFYRVLKDMFVLLFPCFTFMIFVSVLTNASISSLFVKFYFNPESNLWFLWVLFLIHLIFNFGLFLSNKIHKRISSFVPDIISFSVAFVIFTLMILAKNRFNFDILSIKLLGYYLPFYAIGHLFSTLLSSRFAHTKKAQIIFIVCFAVTAFITLIGCFAFKSIYSFSDNNFLYIALRVGLSVCAVYMFVVISDLVTRQPLLAKISQYGAFSLESYYIHLLLIRFINYSTNYIEYQWFLSFMTGLILIVSVILILLVMYFVPFLHLAVFGKIFSRYDIEKRLPIIFR